MKYGCSSTILLNRYTYTVPRCPISVIPGTSPLIYIYPHSSYIETTTLSTSTYRIVVSMSVHRTYFLTKILRMPFQSSVIAIDILLWKHVSPMVKSTAFEFTSLPTFPGTMFAAGFTSKFTTPATFSVEISFPVLHPSQTRQLNRLLRLASNSWPFPNLESVILHLSFLQARSTEPVSWLRPPFQCHSRVPVLIF